MCILEWASKNPQAIINSLGLICDIVGAWLVAWEVVREYQGKRHEVSAGFVFSDFAVGQKVNETKEFADWERGKYLKMKIGLGFLTAGFLLQIASNWITPCP